MTAKLFEAALVIHETWMVALVEFGEAAKVMTVRIDFKPGSRFAVSGHEGTHPVYDTVPRTYRYLNFFQHECHLQVRTPRVKLPNGSVCLVELDFAGRLNGFTLLFDALILMLARQMPFAAMARIVGESSHRVQAVCHKYVEMASGLTDCGEVTTLIIDQAFCARGHGFAPERIESMSIGMSLTFISGVDEHLADARITFDKFHVIDHASAAVDKMRRIEHRTDKSLKGLRLMLSKASWLKPDAVVDLNALIAKTTVRRTVRAWVYGEQPREIHDRKQINVVRPRVQPMKEVAALVRRQMEGIVAWVQSRQIHGFLAAINGLFQTAKRRARGFRACSPTRLSSS